MKLILFAKPLEKFYSFLFCVGWLDGGWVGGLLSVSVKRVPRFFGRAPFLVGPSIFPPGRIGRPSLPFHSLPFFSLRYSPHHTHFLVIPPLAPFALFLPCFCQYLGFCQKVRKWAISFTSLIALFLHHPDDISATWKEQNLLIKKPLFQPTVSIGYSKL